MQKYIIQHELDMEVKVKSRMVLKRVKRSDGTFKVKSTREMIGRKPRPFYKLVLQDCTPAPGVEVVWGKRYTKSNGQPSEHRYVVSDEGQLRRLQ